MSNNWLLWFEELGQEFNDQVGKKCANLGEMTKMGLRVPPGFALSLEAYKDFMSLTGADGEIKEYLDNVDHGFENIQHFNEASVALRKIVESKEMPQDMRELVLSHYQALCQRCKVEEMAVSTRSAGAASHPGQYETHLNVRGDLDVIEKIIKVWSSTFNPRSLSARKRAGAPLEFDPIGDIAKLAYGPPTTAPIGVYQLGDIALVGVPAEPTTVKRRKNACSMPARNCCSRMARKG